MIITCPACGARYDAPDDAIPAAGRMVRCSACRAEWLAGGAEAGAAPAAAPAAQPPSPPASPSSPAGGAPAWSSPTPPTQPPAASAPPAARAAAAPAPQTLSATLEDDGTDAAPRRRGGFMAGFALSTVAGLAAIGVYARHDAIAAMAPQLAGPLDAYVAAVDRARAALAQAAASLTAGF